MKSIDQYEDVYSPEPHDGDSYMEEDITHTKDATLADQGHPPSGTGHQSSNAKEDNDRKIAAEHFNLAPPAAPL